MRAEKGLAVEARMLADNAVALFKDEKFEEGYGLLIPYWPLQPKEIEGLVGQTIEHQATDGWAVNGVSFDDQIDLLFEGQ